MYSGGVSDQIEYAILTRDIYDLCGIESGGFCTGVCSNEIRLTNIIILFVF